MSCDIEKSCWSWIKLHHILNFWSKSWVALGKLLSLWVCWLTLSKGTTICLQEICVIRIERASIHGMLCRLPDAASPTAGGPCVELPTYTASLSFLCLLPCPSCPIHPREHGSSPGFLRSSRLSSLRSLTWPFSNAKNAPFHSERTEKDWRIKASPTRCLHSLAPAPGACGLGWSYAAPVASICMPATGGSGVEWGSSLWLGRGTGERTHKRGENCTLSAGLPD